MQYHKNNYEIRFLRYFHIVLPMISYTYPMNLSMISELCDIISVIAYDICL